MQEPGIDRDAIRLRLIRMKWRAIRIIDSSSYLRWLFGEEIRTYKYWVDVI